VEKLDPHAVKCIFVGYSSTQKGYKCWDPVGRKLFVSMDVTFREFEPYYTKKGDLDQSLEEFSSVNESDSREGENDCEHSNEDNNTLGEIIGTIPSPQVDDAIRTVDTANDNERCDVEDDDVVVDNERTDVEDDEVVVVGTIPCPTTPSSEISDKKGKISEKQPIVYQRRWFKNQEEKAELPQPQDADPSVLVVSSNASPPSSLASTETSGDVSSFFDHVELSLAQCRTPRVNARKPPPRLGFENDIANCIAYSHVSPTYRTFIALLQTVSIPKDWRCAKQNPKWKNAMKEEMSALQKNKTWNLVQLPKERKTFDCKWVFTVKQTPEGKVERYKVRLVAKEYSQTYGIDYDETFTHVAKMSTVRTLISYAVNIKWHLHQLDVKNAFLYGDLEEEVYMIIPPGFAINQTLWKVWKLKKSLYGLKQLPRAWFDRFRRAVCDIGYY
jgi:hypothetical protein